MVMCWAPGCNHYSVRETCRFYRFPKAPKLRAKWKQLVRRDCEPGPSAVLCSCHFPEGKKENGPQFFKHNENRRFVFTSPEPRKRFRRTLTPTKTATSPGTSATDIPSPGLVEVVDSPSEEMEVVAGPSSSRAAEDVGRPGLSSVVVDAAQMKNLQMRFSYEHISMNDKMILLYTGLPNSQVFEALYNLLKDVEVEYYYNWVVSKINRRDQLLLTLMKLRQNFPHEDLAARFSISTATVSNIIISWVYVLHKMLFVQLMATIPSRSKNRSCLPNCFSSFTNCRIILDCTEIYTAVPRKSMTMQKMTYSSYKQRNTWKALVGVAPNGVITFLSGLYPGSTSDKKITRDCGVLNILEPGDLVLADRGFLIRDILPPGVNLNIPPFLSTAQFTPEQIRQTEVIARARIHVERAIRRIKCYKILSFIPQSLVVHAQKVFQVVGALTNLQYPLIREVEEYMGENND